MAAVMDSAAVPAAGGDEKAQRVRDLLSSYYGNNAASPTDAHNAAARPQRIQAGGLDSANFDADRYLSQLLRQARLKDLMSKHIEMSTQIKTLDSDMQNLVYENYNKFISATDTIRSMKAQVGSMDTSMLSLKDMIGELSVLPIDSSISSHTCHARCYSIAPAVSALCSIPVSLHCKQPGPLCFVLLLLLSIMIPAC